MQQRLRLRDARDFQRLRREGQTYRHPLLLISLAPNTLSHNRYGFITSKHLGKAVVRNRVRRICRACVRQLHPDLKQGFDVVIVARARIVAQPSDAVLRALYEVFTRATLLVEKGLSS